MRVSMIIERFGFFTINPTFLICQGIWGLCQICKKRRNKNLYKRQMMCNKIILQLQVETLLLCFKKSTLKTSP